MKEGMATHSGTLAWGIPWTEELGELHFIGSAEKSQTQLSNLAHMQRFLHNKGNNQQSEKAACGKGENIYKLYIW